MFDSESFSYLALRPYLQMCHFPPNMSRTCLERNYNHPESWKGDTIWEGMAFIMSVSHQANLGNLLSKILTLTVLFFTPRKISILTPDNVLQLQLIEYLVLKLHSSYCIPQSWLLANLEVLIILLKFVIAQVVSCLTNKPLSFFSRVIRLPNVYQVGQMFWKCSDQSKLRNRGLKLPI